MTSNEPYKMQEHVWEDKVLNWNVCIKCGLIALKNPFTRWCIKKGCFHEDHPDFERQRKNTARS